MDKDNIKDNLTGALTDKSKERSYGHIMDKIQKLTGALYRVTDLYPDKEPLKWTLRDSALYLYTNLMSIIRPGRMSIRTSVDIDELLNSISQIICTLELASLGGFVSDINFDILRKEYISLKAFLEGKKNDFILEQKFLIEPEFDSVMDEMPKQKNSKNGVHSQPKPPLNNFNERKGKITDFLGKKGRKTIKEIRLIFEGVSEKTIQRDLLDLVKTGSLMAEGEKRWRTYSLTER